MTFRVSIFNENDATTIFEQRVEAIDLRAVFAAVNKPPRKQRASRAKVETGQINKEQSQ